MSSKRSKLEVTREFDKGQRRVCLLALRRYTCNCPVSVRFTKHTDDPQVHGSFSCASSSASLNGDSPRPYMATPSSTGRCSALQAGCALRCQVRRRAAARLARTLSLDAADGLGAADGTARPSSPGLAAGLQAGGAADSGGLRAEVLRAALLRAGGEISGARAGCMTAVDGART